MPSTCCGRSVEGEMKSARVDTTNSTTTSPRLQSSRRRQRWRDLAGPLDGTPSGGPPFRGEPFFRPAPSPASRPLASALIDSTEQGRNYEHGEAAVPARTAPLQLPYEGGREQGSNYRYIPCCTVGAYAKRCVSHKARDISRLRHPFVPELLAGTLLASRTHRLSIVRVGAAACVTSLGASGSGQCRAVVIGRRATRSTGRPGPLG
jgi:hypothetical protein